ncbi:MAG: glycosyltransferase [Candidatus Aenigmarchaeota archaeon]|nr:glycosyltransferase [Candidatus Aenigmarchaeota archaeon]MDW8149417.1 glycosyltransferase [Candidatus Aenigmarchaeota archaeon]
MLELIHQTSLFLYNIFIIPTIMFSIMVYFVLFTILFKKRGINKNNIKSFNPFVSIIIPCYNDPVVERCVNSCLKQDYKNFEIIVADDSTDEKTKKIIDSLKSKKVKVIRRNNRKGFKAGALNNALKYTKGEIIVIFDSDWVIKKNFLKEIVKEFVDEKVAIVQARQDFLNYDKNSVSKFAYLLMSVYYSVFVPFFSLFGVTFSGGTATALRKSVIKEVGGYNENSLTEDTEISIRIICRGYKTVYLKNLKAKGEVPCKLTHFLKQQGRWVYGTTRSFLDNIKTIVNSNIPITKKAIIAFSTFSHIFQPLILFFFLFGQIALLTGMPKPLTIEDLKNTLLTFILTAGFITAAVYTTLINKKIKIYEAFILSILFGSFFLFINSFHFFKAIFFKLDKWFKTPKEGNIKSVKKFFDLKISEPF